ncbi:MAG: hypothetical protein HC927_10120 [Deltaproteobacteria bacterium]|nr:hypothetical protein [Deltaproteobacteria bacterium]
MDIVRSAQASLLAGAGSPSIGSAASPTKRSPVVAQPAPISAKTGAETGVEIVAADMIVDRIVADSLLRSRSRIGG